MFPIYLTTEQIERARELFGDMTRGRTDREVEELVLTEPVPEWGEADEVQEWQFTTNPLGY